MPHPLAYESVVTVSCGAAVTVPGPDDSLENLLGQADDALDEAKAQGRNRVVLAEPWVGNGIKVVIPDQDRFHPATPRHVLPPRIQS